MSQVGSVSGQDSVSGVRVSVAAGMGEAGKPRLFDMVRLPVTWRPLVAARRSWLLHRILLVRIGAAMLVALVMAAGFQVRGGIAQVAIGIGDVMAGRVAAIGFGIEEISITGQSLTMEKDVVAALAIDGTSNIFNFDVEAARVRILQIPSVSDVRLRKIYPSALVIEISEVVPVARWRVDGVTFVIDGDGTQIAAAGPADESLPLVIGDGAADDAMAMIDALDGYPVLGEGLLALSRIADRRWDLIYDSGLRVKLPENGVGQALWQLNRAQQTSQILDRDLAVIDMRVAGIMALRLVERDQAETS